MLLRLRAIPLVFKVKLFFVVVFFCCFFFFFCMSEVFMRFTTKRKFLSADHTNISKCVSLYCLATKESWYSVVYAYLAVRL